MNVFPVKVFRDDKELTVTLKLDTKNLRKLSAKYDNRSPLDIITDASSDPGVLADILDAALRYRNNDNPKDMDGDVLRDLLVEGGFGGMAQSMALANNIAVVSGVMDKEQATALNSSMERRMKKIIDDINNDEVMEEDTDPPTKKIRR